MKHHVYRVGSRRVRATPRSGTRKPAHFRRPWAPFKNRDLILYLVGIVISLICIVPVPVYYWYRVQAEWEFERQAVQGKPNLIQVEDDEDHGRSVLMPNFAYEYGDAFPTSGPYDRDWFAAGFYNSSRAPTLLVHALVRGMVVIYYDKPQEPVLETLKAWAGLFSGDRDGLVVVAHPGLGSEIVLTAWDKRLRLQQFDPRAAAAFIDAFRGRGPERPVR